jgi:hypothetical protein
MRGLDRVVGVHGEMEGATRPRRAGEQQHQADRETPRHLGHAVVPNRVAGDVDGWTVLHAEHKADHVAGDRLDAGGSVPRGRGGHLQPTAVRLRQIDSIPGREPFGAAAEPLRADDSGEDARGLFGKSPA